MSDVAFARASWPIKILYMAFCWIVWLFGCLPVVITRNRYAALRDNELMIEHAHRALRENARLRAKYEPEPHISDADLSHL